MQFWKDCNFWTHQEPALAWRDVTKGAMNDMWKKTLARFVYDFTVFAKNKEVENINKASVEIANDFKLCANKNDMEELLLWVPRIWLTKSCWNRNTAEQEAREKETAEEKNSQENT